MHGKAAPIHTDPTYERTIGEDEHQYDPVRGERQWTASRPRRSFVAVVLAACVALLATMAVVPAANAASDEPVLIEQPVVDNEDFVVVEDFDESGELINTQVFGSETMGQALKEPEGGIGPMGSGSGGSSSSSGCRKVTVNNKVETPYGRDLFWWYTWTRWSWDRSDYDIDSPTKGYSYDIINGIWDYDKQHLIESGYYSYVSGHSQSGYEHEREARFTGACIGGLCDARWAENNLYSHYNGTWYWSTYD